MADIDTWVRGCRVRAMDWVDGKSVYLNMSYYRPGQSLHQPPAKEVVVYLEKCQETYHRLENYLDSIVRHFMEGGLDGKRVWEEGD